MLTDIIPPAQRKLAYGIYALAGLVLGAFQVAEGRPEPHWLLVAFAVYGFVGLAIGATAASNTPSAKRNQKGEIGLPALVPLMVLATLVLVVLMFIGVHAG